MAEEDWEWVHSLPRLDEDEDDDHGGPFGICNGAPCALSQLKQTNAIQYAENLSSSASSPIFKDNVTATVMAKDYISALDGLQDPVSEWIEPQLVFTRPHDYYTENFQVVKVIAWLQSLPDSKETLASLLLDPNVCEAVISNKAFQELACECSDDISKCQGFMVTCDSSLGRKFYMLLKMKLMEAANFLLSLLGIHTFDKIVVDQLDATSRTCILLVVILILFVIGKRSEEGPYLTHIET